jgi:hypothetical protein
MNPILKNTLKVIAAIFIGGVLNMIIIMISGKIIPPPDDADLKTMEGLKAAMHLMQPKHFLMPFLAHALGTFLAAFLIVKWVNKNHQKYAIGVGIWFLVGGVMNVYMLPSPFWFTVADLVGAYIPMAYLDLKLADYTGKTFQWLNDILNTKITKSQY